MGAHYRSVQIRGENRNAVMAAAEGIARSQNGKLLVGPVLNGWIGLYLNDSVPSEGFAVEISKSLEVLALDLIVHDSDIFIYNFYKQGHLIDEYSSAPDYFEEVSQAEHARLQGKPEAFRELLGSDETVSKLVSLLGSKDDEEFLFEENRLEQFAKLLGIKNSLSSYEYLTNGEWEGIDGRKQFTHIPDLAGEKASTRAAAATLRAEMKRLQREGTLCFESLPPGKSSYVPGDALFDAMGDGLLFRWGVHAGYAAGPKLFHAKPPWTSEPEAVDIPGSSNAPTALVFSRTGNLFAYFEHKLRLCDWAEKRLIEGISLESTPVQFSADEKRLLCSTKQGFEVLSIENGKAIQKASAGAEHPHFLAWHPSGRFVVNPAPAGSTGFD
jgi:hypothetical protein